MSSASELIRRFRESAPSSQDERNRRGDTPSQLWWKDDDSDVGMNPRDSKPKPMKPISKPIYSNMMNQIPKGKENLNRKSTELTFTGNRGRDDINSDTLMGLSMDLDALIENEIQELEKNLVKTKKKDVHTTDNHRDNYDQRKNNQHDMKRINSKYSQPQESRAFLRDSYESVDKYRTSVDTLGSTGGLNGLFKSELKLDLFPSKYQQTKSKQMQSQQQEKEEVNLQNNNDVNLSLSEFLSTLRGEEVLKKDSQYDGKTFSDVIAELDYGIQKFTKEQNLIDEEAEIKKKEMAILGEEMKAIGKLEERKRLLRQLDWIGEDKPYINPLDIPTTPTPIIESRTIALAIPSSNSNILDANATQVIESLRILSQQVSNRAQHLSYIHASALDHRLAPTDIYPLINHTSILSSIAAALPNHEYPSLDTDNSDSVPNSSILRETNRYIDNTLNVAMSALELRLKSIHEIDQPDVDTVKVVKDSESSREEESKQNDIVNREVASTDIEHVERRSTTTVSPIKLIHSKLSALDSVLGVGDSLDLKKNESGLFVLPSSGNIAPSAPMNSIANTAHYPLHAQEKKSILSNASYHRGVGYTSFEAIERSSAKIQTSRLSSPTLVVVSTPMSTQKTPILVGTSDFERKQYLENMKKLRGKLYKNAQ